MKHRARRNEKTTMSWMGLIFLFIVMLLCFFPLRNWIVERTQAARLQEAELGVSLSNLHETESGLRQEISLVGGKDYVESLARSEYGYLMPGELRFEFSNPEELATYSAKELAILQAETGQ